MSRYRDTYSTLGMAAALVCSVYLSRAYPSDCGLIREHDVRQYCEALRDHAPGNCGLIDNRDLRSACYARVEKR